MSSLRLSHKAKSERPDGLCDEVRGRGTKQSNFFDWEHAQSVSRRCVCGGRGRGGGGGFRLQLTWSVW